MNEESPHSSVRSLSPNYRRKLITSLKVSMEFEVHHPEADPWPPGATDYSAVFSVSWFPEDIEEASDDDAQILRQLSQNAKKEDDYLTVRAGWAHLVVANVYERSLFDALDAREGDLAHIGGAVLDIGAGELSPELLEAVDGIGQDLFIVNTVEIEKPFRGLSLGLIGTGLALQHLARGGGGVAALYPMEPGTRDEDREKTYARLSTYWGRLGFEPFQDEVHVLDLAMVTLDRRMQDLLERS